MAAITFPQAISARAASGVWARVSVGDDIAGATDYASFSSTFDDGSNPRHYQQQVVASISVPA